MTSLSMQEIEQYKEKCLVGFWKLERENGISVRMYIDENMQKLTGVPDGCTPEECWQFYINHIHPEDAPLGITYEEEMLRGSAEVVYRYNHPTKGEMKVRCSGRRLRTVGNVEVMVGEHKELSNTVQISYKNPTVSTLQRRSRDIHMQESRDFYFSLMDKMPYGVLVVTVNNRRILYMNNEALRIYGANNTEEIEKHSTKRRYIQADAHTLKQLQRLDTEDMSLDCECKVFGLNDKLTDVICHAEVITSLDGERCIFVTLLDVSENKALKKQYDTVTSLTNMLEKAHEIIATAGMGLWEIVLFEGEKPRMKANQKMRELLHLHDDLEDEHEIYNAWYSRVKPEALESVHASVDDMMKGIQNENTYLWEDPVLGDQYVRCGGYGEKIEGKGYILRGYHYNVNDEVLKTQREHIERQRLVDLRLQTVSEAIHGGFKISRNDSEFTLKMVSEQLAKLLGYNTPQELLEAANGCMYGIANIEDAEKCFPEALEAAARGEMYTMHYRIRCKDGRWMNVEDRGRLIKNEKGEEEFWSFIVNQDQLTELENANRAKTQFLFNMSHDIRTPMNAIIGYSQLMKKELTDPKLLDYQRKIDASANLLLSIINHVLDMSSIDSGKLEVKEECTYVPDIAATIINVFEAEAKKKDVALSCKIDYEHNYILCDRTKMNELFTNILSNAIKYTPAGGKVDVLVEELPCEKEGYLLCRSTIVDTGIGMSEEFLPHIFDSFSRERNSTVSGIQGTGLGMSIVKRLVELMEGTIEIESKVGQGTKFVVTLPHKIAAQDCCKKEEKATDRAPQVDLTGKYVLLAEDNELNAEIAMALLQDKGLKVDWAHDGLECLDMLSQKPTGAYDLVLMDIQMPKMNGYEATKAIRQLEDKAKANIPIIAMTANAFEEDKRDAFAAGMNGHIAKPIDVEQAKNAILSVLAK